MNLGEFITKLSTFPQNAKIIIKTDNSLFYPKAVVYVNHDIDNYPYFFHSYRGYYEDIALSLSSKDKDYRVSDILSNALKCEGFYFEGYKGGYFIMSNDSILWLSSYGDNSGLRCKDIIYENNVVYIITIHDQFKNCKQ